MKKNSHLVFIILFLINVLSTVNANSQDSTDANYEKFKVFLKEGQNSKSFEEFEVFLAQHNVANILNNYQLLRQGTDWHKTKHAPFVIPPKKYWKNIILTLILIKNEIIPLVGNVEVVSSFRSKKFNVDAKGAKTSKHLFFYAVDLIPIKKISRAELHNKLNKLWLTKGKKYKMGLGLYKHTRFHIDTYKYRKW